MRMSRGSARAVVVAVLVALGLVSVMVLTMFRSGNSDLWYVLAMALAAVVAIAIVAPGRFSGTHREAGDWSEEVRALEAKARFAKQSGASVASEPPTTGEGKGSAG